MADEDDDFDWGAGSAQPSPAPEWFPARYDGRCIECSDEIFVGEPIRMTDDGAVHADCWSSTAPLRATRATPPKENPVCPTCFLTHPIGACDR